MSNILDAMPSAAKHSADGLSIIVVMGALVEWLPATAALLSIIWTVNRMIHDPKTWASIQAVGDFIKKLPTALTWLTGVAAKAAGLLAASKGILTLLKRKPPQ